MKTNAEIRVENLILLRDRYGTIAALNDALGRRREDSTLAALIRRDIDPKTGKSRGMGDAIARGIETKLALGVGWMDVDHQPNVEVGPRLSGEVPLISWVAAGRWTDVCDPYQAGDAEEWLAAPERVGHRAYALRVRGLSMFNPGGRPSFSEGDVIFVDPDRDAIHGSLVVVRLDDEKEATFKRLLIDGDRRFLEALNPSWPDRIIPINGNATLCGVVVGRYDSFI